MPEIPTFKTEHSLFEMLKDGSKPWDMRRWSLMDDRCYNLSWKRPKSPTAWRRSEPGIPESYEWECPSVIFTDKETGGELMFQYRGVEFVPFAPGWGFILLGQRLEVPPATPRHRTYDLKPVAVATKEEGDGEANTGSDSAPAS